MPAHESCTYCSDASGCYRRMAVRAKTTMINIFVIDSTRSTAGCGPHCSTDGAPGLRSIAVQRVVRVRVRSDP